MKFQVNTDMQEDDLSAGIKFGHYHFVPSRVYELMIQADGKTNIVKNEARIIFIFS